MLRKDDLKMYVICSKNFSTEWSFSVMGIVEHFPCSWVEQQDTVTVRRSFLPEYDQLNSFHSISKKPFLFIMCRTTSNVTWIVFSENTTKVYSSLSSEQSINCGLPFWSDVKANKITGCPALLEMALKSNLWYIMYLYFSTRCLAKTDSHPTREVSFYELLLDCNLYSLPKSYGMQLCVYSGSELGTNASWSSSYSTRLRKKAEKTLAVMIVQNGFKLSEIW